MNLIILSDTHIKQGQSLISHLPEQLVPIIKSMDLIIHAGDFDTIECYKELSDMGKLYAVCGDTDSPELMNLLPDRKVIEIEGIKVGIIHKGQLTSEIPMGFATLQKRWALTY